MSDRHRWRLARLFGAVEVLRAGDPYEYAVLVKLGPERTYVDARPEGRSADNALGRHHDNLFVPPKVRFVERP
jgi:hypothetical protein